MIRVKFYYNSCNNENIMGVIISGHSNYAVHGYDIICAAVSALSQGIIGAARHIVECKSRYLVIEREGYLSFMLDESNKDSELLLKTLKYSIEQIEEQYPKFVSVKEVICYGY